MLRREFDVHTGASPLGRLGGLLLRFLPARRLNEEELRAGLVTAAVACLFALVAPAYALLIWLFESPPVVYYGLALEAFVTTAAALWWLHKGYLRTAAWTLLVGGGFAVFVPFALEGPSSQAACNFTMVTVMAALLVGWRGVLVVGGVSLSLLLAFGVAQQRGAFQPEPSSSSLGVFALIQVVSLIVMLVVFDRLRLGTLRAQRALEAKLVQAQRLEAIGRLAGGVAHDFNNLLFVILANAEEVLTRASSKDDVFEANEIRKAAERAAQLTRQLLMLSRRQKLQLKRVDLGELLREESSLLRRLLPENIRFDVTAPDEPVWLEADPAQLSQVLFNLTANARDAMSNGGGLRIDVQSSLHPATGSRFATLTVSDTGAGMDPLTVARAFEPFYTTKGPSAGSGLGLAIVQGVIEQLGGQVKVQSQLGSGTTFTLLLPEVPMGSSSTPVPSPRPSAGPRPLTLLLLEDDAGVAALLTRGLQSEGHTVFACADAESALSVWKEHLQIDVVISDVVLPGTTGPNLVRQLLAVRPLRVLFISGYLDDSLRDPLLRKAAFLAKPFGHDELHNKLAEVLSGPVLD